MSRRTCFCMCLQSFNLVKHQRLATITWRTNQIRSLASLTNKPTSNSFPKGYTFSVPLQKILRNGSTRTGGQNGIMNVFDRKTKTHQKNVAASMANHNVYDYLKNEYAELLADRVADIDRFIPKALDLGAGKGYIARHLSEEEVGTLYQLDSSEKMLDKCQGCEIETVNVVADEELLPFEDNYFDMVISCLSLHWVNDLPGVLIQVKNCLKEDGVFLGALFGSDTLYQLRGALQLAEIEREGGFAPHISPFAEMRDIGSLLQRAGLNLTTIDYDEITIDYPSIFELMEDLKGMGENNAAWNRKLMLHRETLMAAAAIYKEMYGNDDGTIPATFQVLYMIGWKPSLKQSKPLQRGSQDVSFQDLGNVVKIVDDHDKKK